MLTLLIEKFVITGDVNKDISHSHGLGREPGHWSQGRGKNED